MATSSAVLGVIRASRPTLKSALEKVAFAVHAAFLAAGYSVVAIGKDANICPTEDIADELEVGSEGWNDLEGAFSFRYSGGNQQDLCIVVVVKLVVMGDLLMVDAWAPTRGETLLHMEIKAIDYAKDGEGGPYAQQFTKLEELVNRINVSLLTKLSPIQALSINPPTINTLAGQSGERPVFAPDVYDSRRTFINPGFVFPSISAGGSNDLHHVHGGGVVAPRRDDASNNGMFVGPNDARWGRPSGNAQPGPLIPGVIPGARFDPFGPSGVPGYDSNSHVRPPQRPPGGHPDLEHFTLDF